MGVLFVLKEVVKITIRDSLYFSYAGKKSVDFGIINVNVSSGMQEEPLGASRSIQEVSIRGRDRPYFQDIKKEPLQFKVSLAFEDVWDTQKIREVARWLTDHDYYQEFYFTNEIGRDPEKIYYALFVDDPILVHNGLKQGYITLTVRCDSATAYSPTMTSRLYQWDDRTITQKVTDFSLGEKKSIVLDSNGYLALNPHRPRWIDYPSPMKWYELNP